MKNYNTWICKVLQFLMVIGLYGLVWAKDPIEITLTSAGGTATAGFSDLSEAMESLKDPDAYYGGTVNLGDDFVGVINILGFEMNVTYTNTPPTLTYMFLDKDGNPVSRTFTGSTQEEVFEKLKDFFKSELGREDFGKYMEVLQKRALFNFVTGPQSPVGQSVRDNTRRALGGDSRTLAERQMFRGGESTFSIGVEYITFENGGYEGRSYTVPIQIGGRLGSIFRLDFYLLPNYTDLEGASFYRLGTDLELGIRLIGSRPQMNPFEWEITPTIGNYLMGSSDLMVGGDVYNHGIQNRFQWNTPHLSLVYGIYWGRYRSKKISIGDLDVDFQVDEQILSQGLKAIWYLGRNITLDLFAIRSRPYKDAVGFYETHSQGVTFNFRLSTWSMKESFLFKVGYLQETGEDKANQDYESRHWIGQLIYRY